jgi:dTDP-4-amino-4,6-dideoxygalactose transaminase
MQFLDLKSQYESIKKEIDSAVSRVLENCVFIGGKEVEEFEKEAAEFCGVEYAIGVNSGTDALLLSLKALGIGQGDEVITSPFTFIATAEVVANCGATPVFCDIDPETFNISPLEIEKRITKNTKAIIPVHLFGQIADMDEIMEIAKKHNLFVIEDACQAIGAEYKDKKAGTFGDFGCFSFFPSKNLGACGDGGLIITDNEELADKVRLLKNHGSSPNEKYLNLVIGTNSRLDAIQAAILKVKIKYLSEWSKKRAEKAAYYTEHLGESDNKILTPLTKQDRTHIFHQYTIRAESRNSLRSFLKENEIPTMIYYSLPLHLQPAFEYLGYKEGDFPQTESAAKEVLSLPIYPEMERENQDFVIKGILDYVRK